jgi:diacylglycerol kinase family enzyme
MPGQRLTVIVNREGGAARAAGESLPDRIVAAFAAAGVAADVRMLAGSELAPALQAAAATDSRVVIAGGDGTAATAAQALIGTGTELGLLPLGTLNHLARDLGIPADLEQAAAIAARGRAIRIDLGEVNGHRFVNNASIGLYPSMVRQREGLRARNGWPKWLASVPAAWEALSRLRHHRLRVEMGKGDRPLVTPLLFVGNNQYTMKAGAIGARASLQDGCLSVYAVADSHRMQLVAFALRALIGRIHPRTDFVVLGKCDAMVVHAHSSPIEIALDGEIGELSSPLEFRILPGVLTVVVPELE